MTSEPRRAHDRIPAEELRRIRGASDIEAAARFYGLVLHQNTDELVGTAPFSKTEDAFRLNVSRQRWFDRSVDRTEEDDHGRSKMLIDRKPHSADIFGLVMALGRLSFPKAVKLVSERFVRL